MLVDSYPLTYSPGQRLLDMTDAHGALVAEFDYFPDHHLLYVRWHGHLTAASVIECVEAGTRLRDNGVKTRFLLNDKSLTSGDWSDALPWLQYEWLPLAAASGLQAVAYVCSPDPTSQVSSLEFIKAVRLLVPLSIFPNAGSAWKWLLRRVAT